MINLCTIRIHLHTKRAQVQVLKTILYCIVFILVYEALFKLDRDINTIAGYSDESSDICQSTY